MNQRRSRQTLPPQFHKYLKPGALARIRDSKISARSHRLNSRFQISDVRPLSSPLPDAAQPQVNAVDGFPLFIGGICGPCFPQRKKLVAAKSVFLVPVNPSPDSPDLVIDSFGSDILVAN